MRNPGLDEAQVGIKIAGKNINHLRYVEDTTLMAESEEELKSLLIRKAECQRIILLNCGVGEDSLESFGLQADPTSPF